ncbi:hypothetical protein EDB85DRAFT_2076297 [Lactarius pseudohatsudake]|nr:hypothetical protein EDB85DRAFT_2076297 [Lactarius pseudohatsudake]
MPASKEVQRKPRQSHKPYDRVPKPPKNKNLPKTSAITKPKQERSNLTLSDWLKVVQYYDSNQPISQPEVVKYFSNCSEGKKARVVTRPDVEKALFLWVKHMEEKLEHVTSAMLVAKRGKFEDLLEVPEEERLHSDGWVQKFCRA